MHLFFTCSFSRWCWTFLGVQWNANLDIMEMVIQARRDFGLKIFREIIIVASWAIWTHRNEVIFDGVPLSLRDGSISARRSLVSFCIELIPL